MKQEMITIMASSDYTAYDIADMIDIRYHYSVALITPVTSSTPRFQPLTTGWTS